VFTDMRQWTEIRRKVLVEGVSKRRVCREHGIAFETLQKILSHPEPPGYRQRAPRPQTKLGPYLPAIEEILASDRDAPPKQHHTAKRIFERLRDEHGYQGGLTQVRVAVAAYRRRAQEVFVPLRHPPGEAQFDFGYATVRIGGRDSKAAFAVMSLPYSDAFHVSAYPRECTETFQAAHVAAFRFFGGVPRRISYDNSKIAVKKVMGRERELTREFLRLQSHHLFTHRFCRVARGNEKGHVEGLVGYSRRNFMVPVPEASSFAELNNRLEARCRADLDRTLWGATKTKAELLEDDRAAMLPLPPVTFEARRVVQTRANSLSLVRFDRNDYSVPTSFAHHELVVVGGIEEVRIACRDQLVARHPRSWEREQVSFDPVHYLGLLERKPGALDVARPLESWELPGCFALLRRRLEADLGHRGTREYIKVLRLMERASLSELAGAVRSGLAIGATSSDAISLILHHRQERPVALFSLDGLPHLRPYRIDPPDLSAYASLEGASA
jgi:transposase